MLMPTATMNNALKSIALGILHATWLWEDRQPQLDLDV
jgi:hypothetical protein